MKTGDLIYWTIGDLKVEPNLLVELGYEGYVPRNDYKSAMCKAMTLFKKGTDRTTQKADVAGSDLMVFGSFMKSSTSEDISIEKEFTFTVNKKTGEVNSENQEFMELFNTSGLRESYESSKVTLNSHQIRTMFGKMIKEEFYGISLKQQSGIHFVDEKFSAKAQEKLKKFFEAFPTETSLHIVAMHDDKGSLEAVEAAVSGEIYSEIESLINGISKDAESDDLTDRKLENDKADVEKLLLKVKAHENGLRDQLSKVTDRISRLSEGLNKAIFDAKGKIVSPGEFMKLLREIPSDSLEEPVKVEPAKSAADSAAKIKAARAKIAKLKEESAHE